MNIVEVVTQLVNNVGFPVAAFLLMFYQNMKLNETLKQNTDAINELSKRITVHNVESHSED